jgi:hypothetical protein
VFLPNLNFHSSNRLVLLILSFLLLAAIVTHPRPQRSLYDASNTYVRGIRSRLTQLLQLHARTPHSSLQLLPKSCSMLTVSPQTYWHTLIH